jgi:hypothetical protein
MIDLINCDTRDSLGLSFKQMFTPLHSQNVVADKLRLVKVPHNQLAHHIITLYYAWMR